MLAYLRVQLLNKWKAYDPRSHIRPGRNKLRTIAGAIGLTILALYLCGVIVFMEMLLFDQFQKLGQAQAVLIVGLLACTFITLIYGFFSLSGQLFFGRDTGFVAALPLSSRSVLAVKTLMVALGEMGVTLLFCAPLVIRLGIATGAGVAFYVKAFLACLFVPLIPLAVALLLSFGLIRVSGLWKRREGVTTLMSFAVAIGAMLLSMASQSMKEEDIQRLVLSLLLGQGSLTDTVAGYYPPLRWVNDALLTSGAAGVGKLLAFMAVSLAVTGLMVWLLGGQYLRLASRQEETLRKQDRAKRLKTGKDVAHTPFQALLVRELREVVTIPAYATNCLMGIVMFPMMIVIVLVSMQAQSETVAMVSQMATLIPRDWFFACALGFLCISSGMGMAVSTAVSREGARHQMRKTYPVSGFTFLKAKVVMGMLFNLLTALSICVVLWIVLPAFWAETLLALLASQLFSLLWCSLALILDVYNPKLDWKNETEAVKQNMNGMLSMLVCLGMVAVLVLVVWLCVRLGAPLTAGTAVAVALMLAGDAIALKWLMGKATATYFLR